MCPPTPMPGRCARCTMHRRVPPDVGADAPLDVLVAGEPGLALRRDRVDVVGGGQRRHADLALTGALEQAQHDVAGALAAALVDDAVERLDPLERLLGIDVRKLARQAVADHRALAFGGHRRSLRPMARASSSPVRVLPSVPSVRNLARGSRATRTRRSSTSSPSPIMILPRQSADRFAGRDTGSR